MISRDAVDPLLARAPTAGSPVLSVYLDVDQARAANQKPGFEVALKAQLRTVEQELVASEREAFRADAARALDFVTQYQPHLAKTLVLFADDSADLFWSGDLRVSLPTDTRWDPTAHLRPLVQVFDEYERYGILLVNKDHARIFTVFLGEIEEEREAFAAAETRHKQASGTDHLRSQMNFQRQDDVHVRWHLRRVGELMQDVARAHAFDRLVLAGPVEATSELARLLPRPLAERVVGTLRLPIDAPADQILERTLEVAEQAEREKEKTRVAELRERGVIGLDTTLAALQEGRVLVLVCADGFAPRGSECPRCHALWAAAAGPDCGYCGAPLLPLDDLVGRAVARTHESGARVDEVRGEAAAQLLDAGGIGALLSF